MATLRVGSRVSDDNPTAAFGGWVERLRASRPLQVVLVAGLFIFAAVIVGTILLVQELRSREMADARRGLMNLNAVLTEGTGRALQSVDLVLRSIAEELKADGVTASDEYRRLKSGRDTHERLRAKISGLPQLSAISLVGADGKLINFSRVFPVPAIDLSDRDHFIALRDTTVPEPFVSAPVQNRGTSEWTVYVARRVVGPSGAFAGIVYGALELRYFEEFYASLDLGHDSSISIWHANRTLLLRHPRFERVGQRFDTPAFHGLTPASPPLIYENPVGIDGQSRLVARRVLPDFPIVVATSRTVEDALAEWRRLAIVFGVAGALVAAAIVAVMGALAQQFAAYEEVGRAVRDKAAAVQGRADAEAQLRQSQKLEVMGQLTSGVAHDFNNLITIVIGNLDLLARRLPADLSGLRRHVEGARGGAERAAALTRRLLAFSRRQALEPTILDVNELVRGLSDLLGQTLGENMTLRLDLAPELDRIFADPNQLEAALLNLVVNARDAMPSGGTVTVETRNHDAAPDEAGSDRQFVRLTVADTGFGMSPEVMSRAFEPFFTTKEPGVGTGLGLAQVYGFVRQSEGDVAIESTEGAGTRITLRLPRVGDPA